MATMTGEIWFVMLKIGVPVSPFRIWPERGFWNGCVYCDQKATCNSATETEMLALACAVATMVCARLVCARLVCALMLITATPRSAPMMSRFFIILLDTTASVFFIILLDTNVCARRALRLIRDGLTGG